MEITAGSIADCIPEIALYFHTMKKGYVAKSLVRQQRKTDLVRTEMEIVFNQEEIVKGNFTL